MGQFCYPKAEKAGSKDAFEKADFRYQLPDEFSDSQRKELQTSDLRLYPMKRKALFSVKPSRSSRPASTLILLEGG